MFDYELFLYRGKPYCHWVDSRNEHGVNLLEGGRGFFWSSFPCVGKDRIMYDREHWDMLPSYTLAWRNFGVGYSLAFTSESCSDPYLMKPYMFKIFFRTKLSTDMGSIYIYHLGQFHNYGGVIHFDKVESRCKDIIFWFDGLTTEVMKDILS